MTWVRATLFACVVLPAAAAAQNLATASEPGSRGGRLVCAQRAEPKTLNPVLASDIASREVIHRMMGDLVHINRGTHATEPALATHWTISPDGRRFTLRLRRGVRFSDGHPFDADDVLFTFEVYLDPQLHSPQRDLLMVAGKPLSVRKQDSHTVVFETAAPYAPAERLFDSIAMLPRHLLEKPYREGRLAKVWNLNTPPAEIAGLGPFRLKEYAAGQHVVLERNPYYWKVDRAGTRLPYLDALLFVFVSGEDAQIMRFEAGETDVIGRVGARNFAALEKGQGGRGYALRDLGPSLEYNFLAFNLNDLAGRNLPRVEARQAWFREERFRQAVSAAVDREAIVKLVYGGHGTALWGHVTPGNRNWVHPGLATPPRSLDRARGLLKSAGYSWDGQGTLVDPGGSKVEFTIAASSSSAERGQIAAVVQEDLRQVGMRVRVVPLEFRALLDRLFQSRDFDAVLLGLGGGDADPAAEMNVWLSGGGTHLWDLGRTRPATPWEAEIDSLMNRQLITMRVAERKRLYARVQELVGAYLPVVPLASPHVLVGAKTGLGNFRPAVLDHYTLWNVEELYWRGRAAAGSR
ncbi:MAG TPA: ABC transporter substrate-binding protein [Bryobacteraceae bacterium]|nr:ABC transporter substrate-binding protein [Bryobacteraceae bacterium]